MIQRMPNLDESRHYYEDITKALKKVTDKVEKTDPELAEDIKELVAQIMYTINYFCPSAVVKNNGTKEEKSNESI